MRSSSLVTLARVPISAKSCGLDCASISIMESCLVGSGHECGQEAAPLSPLLPPSCGRWPGAAAPTAASLRGAQARGGEVDAGTSQHPLHVTGHSCTRGDATANSGGPGVGKVTDSMSLGCVGAGGAASGAANGLCPPRPAPEPHEAAELAEAGQCNRGTGF